MKRSIDVTQPDTFANYPKDAPLRLDTAAKIAFPDGTIGVKGLRKERDAGRLTTEIIANKEYTTLAAIERMRELCRVQPSRPASSGERKAGNPMDRSGAKKDGTSKTERSALALASVKAKINRLKNASPNTSDKSILRPASGRGVHSKPRRYRTTG